jgi:ribonuclease/clavin/mitogillin
MIEVLAVRTPTLPPATHTNSYRVGRVVIDPASPWPEEQERLAAWAGPVERILLTHHHGDHIGGVEDLRRRTGAKVCAHADARLPFSVDERLGEGDLVPTGGLPLRCLHTPGHADGHLAFQLGDTGEVIVGDLLAGVGTIVIAPPEGHLRTYLGSLERIARIASRAHPAHGPALEDAPRAVAQLVAHRHGRTAQLEALLERGPRTPGQLAGEVYGRVPGVDLKLAEAQVRAHLAWLAEEGRAFAEGGRWRLGKAPPDARLQDAGEVLAALLRGAGAPRLRVIPGGKSGEE